MKTTLKHIVRCLPLVLFLTFYVGTTGFVHVHYIDGQAVTHSHPFAAGTEHQHSSAAFHFIQHLSQFHSTTALLRVISVVFAGFALTLLSVCVEKSFRNEYYHSLFCRPPPAV